MILNAAAVGIALTTKDRDEKQSVVVADPAADFIS